MLTVDSIGERSPILALVTEDQWWNGVCVVPAGTEAHGVARVDRVQQRVLAEDSWSLVLPAQPGSPAGRTFRVEARILERADPDGAGLTWALTDGALGLSGQVIHTTDQEELKLFAATFLGSAAAALQETETNAFGQSRPTATARNAALAGSQALLGDLAARLLGEIRTRGSYIRVPAGRTFYLYVVGPIDGAAPSIPSP